MTTSIAVIFRHSSSPSIMPSNDILFPPIPQALIVVPTTSQIRRRSTRRPLRSSPLTGPPLSSEGAIIQQDHVQGRPKPSRISSLPDCWIESLPPVPSIEPDQRKISLPGHLTKSTSTPSLTKTSSSYATKSSRPSSPGNTHSLPFTPSQNIPHAIHRNSSPLYDTGGKWLISNTYEETPRFSRLSKGSNIVMPVSVKEHRRKSLASVKSQPDLRGRSTSGTCDAYNEQGATFHTAIQPRRSFSSLTSRMRRRASAFVSADNEATESQSTDSPRRSYSKSLTSRSSSLDDHSDTDFITPPPPGSPHSRESSISNLVIVDEEAEDLALSAERQIFKVPEHQRSESDASSMSKSLAVDSRNNSFGVLKLRTKDVLRKSRSFVHSRATSTADPILGSTITPSFVTPRKHVKGFSFLSFTSSDDSHSVHVPPVPSVPDGMGMTTISDTSSDSDLATDDTHIDYQKEAKQLLYDAFPRPPSLHHDIMPSTYTPPASDPSTSANSTAFSDTCSHIFSDNLPLMSNLKSNLVTAFPRTPTSPKSFSTLQQPPITPISTVSSGRTLASPTSPTFPPFRRSDQMLPPNNLGLGGRPYISALDLPTSSVDSPTASFLTIGDDNDIPAHVPAGFRRVPGTTSAKAMNLLGVLDDSSGRNSTKPQSNHDKAVPKTVGTMKKLWKNLTKGEKDLAKSRV